MFALTRGKKSGRLAVGQRFRKRDAPLVVWEISSLFKGIDGVPYAAMFRVDEPSMHKTVAQSMLERGSYYLPVRER